MKKLFSLILSTLLISSLAGCTNASSTDSSETATTEVTSEVKKIQVAFLPNENAEDPEASRISNEMLVTEIQNALGDGYKVEAVFADDYSAVKEAILTGTAQIAWESGATYASAHLQNEKVIPLVSYAKDGDKSNTGYPAYIATHKNNAADFEGKTTEEMLDQLKGKSFAFVAPTSTSGSLVPTTTLFEHFGPNGTGEIEDKSQVNEKTEAEGGIFSEIQMGGNHPGSVQLIANEKVYAGAFCCNYGDDVWDDLYIIAEATVPNGPLWVNSEYLTEEEMNKITEYFVNLTPENAIENFFSDENGFFWESEDKGANRFYETSVEDYDFVYSMYAE